MRIPAVCAAVAVVTLPVWGFRQVVPASPGAYVAVLTAATVGFGPFYGVPTLAVVDLPWRRLRRLRALAARAHTRWLARQLRVAGSDARIRRRIRSRADVLAFRREAVGRLLNHGLSAVLHAAAGVALAAAGHPLWGVVAVVAGLLVHGWPALLQVGVLGRVDELQATVQARRGVGGAASAGR